MDNLFFFYFFVFLYRYYSKKIQFSFIEHRQNFVKFPILLALHRFLAAFQLSNLANKVILVAHKQFHRDTMPVNQHEKN